MKHALLRHTGLASLCMACYTVLTALVPAYWDLQLAQTAYLWCACAGLTVLVGYGGQFSLGQGAFMAVGAYTTALLMSNEQWPLAAVLPASAATAAVLGGLVGAACSRLRGPYVAGATLALGLALPSLTEFGHLGQTLQGENGLTVPVPSPPVLLGHPVPLECWQAWICGLTATAALWALTNFCTSRYGRALRAAADDESAAALCGVHAASAQALAFILAAATAGLAGALLAWVTSLAAPGAFTLTLSLELLAAVVLGGLGSLTGALWGSLLLVLLPNWTSSLSTTGGLSTAVADNLPGALFGATLILVMTAFPNGIQGAMRRLAVSKASVSERWLCR